MDCLTYATWCIGKQRLPYPRVVRLELTQTRAARSVGVRWIGVARASASLTAILSSGVDSNNGVFWTFSCSLHLLISGLTGSHHVRGSLVRFCVWPQSHTRLIAQRDSFFVHRLYRCGSNSLHAVSVRSNKSGSEQREYMVDCTNRTRVHLTPPFSISSDHRARLRCAAYVIRPLTTGCDD